MDKISKKFTEDDVRNLLNKNNPTIKYASGFIGAKKKAEFFCEICKEYFKTQAYDVYTGNIGCPVCYKKYRGINNMNERLKINNPDIEYVDGYIEPHKKATFRCKKCGYEWRITAYEVYTGRSHCPECGRGSRVLTEDEVRKRVKENNPDVEYKKGYTGSLDRAIFGCLKCGHEWDSLAFPVYSGHTGCPKCAPKSKGEDRIARYLDSKHIDYEVQKEFSDCKNVYPLPFDFYIQQLNTCIEYDGEFHFMPVVRSKSMTKEKAQENFEKLKVRDEMKNNYCKNNNIKLIRIPYTEFKNIEKILHKELNDTILIK